MKIYLVRHAETDANKNKVMQGQTQNLQLNENGIRQATNLKNKLKDIKFNVCFTSPMIRTWSTAMILVGDRVEIKEDKRLIERYLGNLEGKDRKTYDASKYWDYTLNSNDDDVEKIQDVFNRCQSFINDLKERGIHITLVYYDDSIFFSECCSLFLQDEILKVVPISGNSVEWCKGTFSEIFTHPSLLGFKQYV